MIWTTIILAVLALIWIGLWRLNRYPPLGPHDRRQEGDFGLMGSGGGVNGPMDHALMLPHTEYSLTADLRAWCERHGYRHVSVHELLMDPTLTPEQFKWLHGFVKAWERLELAGSKA